jgi:hypothetical protein
LKVLLLLIAIAVFLFSGISAVCQASIVADPWTQEAATFNPVGVKYAGGVTTGQEISNHVPTVWAESSKVEYLTEFNQDR